MADTRDDPKNEPKDEAVPGGLSRRTFLGALGASAVAGAFLGSREEALGQEAVYWY